MNNIFAPSDINIANAIQILRSGGLIGLPTETVYGLGGDCGNENAIAKIFALKNRPNFNPLISHVTGLEMAEEYGVFSPLAQNIAKYFWPNALTIVVPRKKNSLVCDLACAGLETIALRSPKHKIAQKIINDFGRAIAAPSANISGKISPTSAQDVKMDFGGKLQTIIDGGDCFIGLESTVIAILDNEITILRLGAITKDEIAHVAKIKVNIANLHDENSPASPGMLLRHYSPNAHLFLNSYIAEENEILIGFGEINGDFNLSKDGDLVEAAANLYKLLRLADSKNPKKIKIAPIPNNGIGAAINDRLSRAAEKS